MACTCIHTVAKNIATKVSEKLGVSATAKPDGLAIGLTADFVPVERTYMPFVIQADKAGFRKGKPHHVFFTFCPWCGVRYEAEPVA